MGGSGRSGRWSSEGQVGSSGDMVQFICIIRPERLDTLLDTAFDLVEKHIGVVAVPGRAGRLLGALLVIAYAVFVYRGLFAG